MASDNETQPAFEATWQSLENYSVPDWYIDAKFGIFIHWGPYSVPAFSNEWYPRNMYIQGTKEYEHHLKTYGSQADFGYKDFIPEFRAEKFDPGEWADLFKASGAKFVVPVAEHHDGFPMYDCSLSDWNAVKMGPQRDVIAELAREVRELGMVFGVSTHRAEHWWFFNGGLDYDSDVQDPAYADFYGPPQPGPQMGTDDWSSRDWQPRPDAKFLEDWLARTCELVDKYQPHLVWFDWWIEQIVFQPYVQRFAAYYYNRAREWGIEVAINYKNDTFPKGAAVFDVERGQLSDIPPFFWQTDTAISKKAWCYIKIQDYKTVTSVIGDLVDIVSKNGALLLNIGPRPDGTIPDEEQRFLRDIGSWLAVNGEAIFETRPWQQFGEGPTEISEGHFTDTKREAFTSQDIRFTTRENNLYAICLDWPGSKLNILSLSANSVIKAENIAQITMLGDDKPLSWSQDNHSLSIDVPATRPCNHAYTFKLKLQLENSHLPGS